MLLLNFNPFPVLETERLVLRRIEMSDAEEIFRHRIDERVNKFLDGFRHASLEDTHLFIERIQREIEEKMTILWVLTEKGKNKFMGTVCFWRIVPYAAKAETGYTLDPAFHNQGYMHEALSKILEYGFQTMKLETVEAYTRRDNVCSRRLLQKNKFEEDTCQQAPAGSNRIIFIRKRN